MNKNNIIGTHKGNKIYYDKKEHKLLIGYNKHIPISTVDDINNIIGINNLDADDSGNYLVRYGTKRVYWKHISPIMADEIMDELKRTTKLYRKELEN